MTNAQLYLAIAIPTIATIVGFIAQNQRFGSIEKRLDTIDGRLSGIKTAMRGVYETAGAHGADIATLKERRS